jgi:hypothetical protein
MGAEGSPLHVRTAKHPLTILILSLPRLWAACPLAKECIAPMCQLPMSTSQMRLKTPSLTSKFQWHRGFDVALFIQSINSPIHHGENLHHPDYQHITISSDRIDALPVDKDVSSSFTAIVNDQIGCTRLITNFSQAVTS